MKCVQVLRYFVLIILVFISSCNSSENYELNGGYSWWSGPYLAASNNQKSDLYVTGIKRKGSKGVQWVAEVKVKEESVEVIDLIELNALFKHDEHNAPAILQIDSNIIIAATGHANESLKGRDKVLIYTGTDIKQLQVSEISTPELATYTQLHYVNNTIYLFTRLSNKGYFYTKSQDFGRSWEGWLPLFQSGYVKVSSYHEGFNFFIGSNPATDYNSIYYINALIDNTNNLALSNESTLLGELNTGELIRNADLLSFYTPAQALSSRILDAQNYESSLSLIATHVKSTIESDETWSLSIAVAASQYSSTGVYNIKSNIKGVLGERTEPLNAGYYVLGASIAKEVNGVVSIVYIEQENDNYKLMLLEYDLYSHNILSEQLIYSTTSEIYRPVIFHGNEHSYIMFNEASYWHNYLEWSAIQKILPLN